MEDKTYSMANIAEIIGRQPTTVNDWKKRFKEYIPEIPGPKPRYHSIVINIMKEISLGYEEKLTTDEIKRRLERKFARTVEQTTDVQIKYEDTNESPMDELTKQNEALLQAIGQMYQEVKELRQTVEEIKGNSEVSIQQGEAIQEELGTLKQEIKAGNEWAVHKVEDTLREIEGKREIKSWWSKILGL